MIAILLASARIEPISSLRSTPVAATPVLPNVAPEEAAKARATDTAEPVAVGASVTSESSHDSFDDDLDIPDFLK